MFAKLCTLVFLLPHVSAFTINALVGATTGGETTITWTASTTDPTTFSIELVNTAFHNTYAIGNNVETALGQLVLTLPQVPPEDGYTIEAVAVNDINTVYAQSGDFAIGSASSSLSTAASTTSASTSSATGTATTATATVSSASVTVPTTSATVTAPVSSASSSTLAASSSTASSTPSSFSSGAASFKALGVAPAAVLALSAVAGAAMVF